MEDSSDKIYETSVEESSIATSTTEETTTLEITTEETTVEETTIEETTVEETTTEETTTEETTVEETTVEETTTEETTTEETTVVETTVEETTIEETTVEKTTVEETTIEETTIEETTTEETTTEETYETTSEVTSEMTEEATSQEITVETTELTSEETTEEVTEEVTEGFKIDLSLLSEDMKYLFSGNTVRNETVFFIDKGEEKGLLYPATKVISVTSYDGKVVYTEGVDYILTDDGKLKVCENSSIPCITSEVYYNHNDSMLQVLHNGENKCVYWGEGDTMTKWQVCVSYEHNSTWSGFSQDCNTEQFEKLIDKLKAGEDVTFVFYGDSITCGGNSSWYVGIEPSLGSYPMLFTEAIADVFGYTVNYVDVSHLDGSIKKTPESYVGGNRGTINYINPSVGGWTAKDGVTNFKTFIKPYIEEYGCDLLVVAFAGNDACAAHTPTMVANNYKKIIDEAYKICPELHFMMVSSMINTPLSTNGWHTPSMLEHEAEFSKAARKCNLLEGIPGSIIGMTSMSVSLLDYKDFVDYTGNNINHPNDFLHRVYAQFLFQSFIGY